MKVADKIKNEETIVKIKDVAMYGSKAVYNVVAMRTTKLFKEIKREYKSLKSHQ